MKQKNSGVNWMFLLFGGIFFVVGMSLLISGIGVLRSTQKFLNRAEVIEGTISDIQVRYDSDGDAHHSVFVRYTYEGQEYETGLSEYSSSMHIGQSIRLYVDPRNPYSVRSKSMAYFLPIMLMGMGAQKSVAAERELCQCHDCSKRCEYALFGERKTSLLCGLPVQGSLQRDDVSVSKRTYLGGSLSVCGRSDSGLCGSQETVQVLCGNRRIANIGSDDSGFSMTG